VSPVKYELGFYIPEDDILHSHRGDHRKRRIHSGNYCLFVGERWHRATRFQITQPKRGDSGPNTEHKNIYTCRYIFQFKAILKILSRRLRLLPRASHSLLTNRKGIFGS
jgi:hypothetical protein